MQAEAYHVFRSGNSTTPLDQDSEIYFILRVHLICWLWTKQAGFQRCKCYLQWLGNMLQTSASWFFSEYGWSETLISDNGPCYTVDAFTSVMNAHHVNHITSPPTI